MKHFIMVMGEYIFKARLFTIFNNSDQPYNPTSDIKNKTKISCASLSVT